MLNIRLRKNTSGKNDKNSKDDVDNKFVSIHKFMNDLASGQTYCIDMIHCENPDVSSPLWEEIVANRKLFYTKSMKSYIGYVKQQANKYGIKGSRVNSLKNVIESLEK